MELNISENSEPDRKTDKEDGFDEYVQAIKQAPIFEPEIEQSEDNYGASPSPIVIKDLSPQIRDKHGFSTRGTPVNTSFNDPTASLAWKTPTIHVQPNTSERVNIVDADFGQIIEKNRPRTSQIKRPPKHKMEQ